MSPIARTTTRFICVATLGTALAGCNYNRANDGVRNGPQAIHPSSGAPAQVDVATPVTAPATICGAAGQPACYTPHYNDGSQPIID